MVCPVFNKFICMLNFPSLFFNPITDPIKVTMQYYEKTGCFNSCSRYLIKSYIIQYFS